MPGHAGVNHQILFQIAQAGRRADLPATGRKELKNNEFVAMQVRKRRAARKYLQQFDEHVVH